MKQRAQFNTRINSELKNAVSIVCDATEFTRDELAEVALATLFGSRDELILAKRNKAVEAFKEKRIKLPFELPLSVKML